MRGRATSLWTRRQFLRGAGLAGTAALLPWLAACRGTAAEKHVEPSSTPEARLASAPGVSEDTIKLGSIYPLTGPAAEYAPIVQTMDAFFKRTNDLGGVHGRDVQLVTGDDQYVPAQTAVVAKRLVEQDGIFAFAGNFGTPTTAAIVEYTTAAAIPLLYVASGSPAWGDHDRYAYTMGLQPSYVAEGRALGRWIATNWGGKKTGIIYAGDDASKAYLACKDTLGADTPVVGEVAFEPGALDLAPVVADLKQREVEILVLAGEARQVGLALHAATALSWRPLVVVSSTAASGALFGLAGGAANVEGVISSTWQRQYDDGSAESGQVSELLARYAPEIEPGALSMTGYIIASVMVETLRRAGINPTRPSLMAAAESFREYSLPQLPPGGSLSTSATDHSPLKGVQLMRATGGRFVPFGDVVSG